MNNSDAGFKPPYMSFQTFWSFIDELAQKPLPPQIDRSLMDSKSGTDQAHLMAVLKGFGLIREDLTVEPSLEELVTADEEGRRKVLGRLVEHHYPDALRVSAENGTEKLLHDSFRDAFGLDSADTRRKAVTFFLHAARTAGMSLSPHFPTTRGSGGGAPRPRRAAKRKPSGAGIPGSETGMPAPGVESADSYKVNLRCGGSVTLTVSVSHFALSKDKDDRKFVNDLIDALTDYGEVETEEVPAQV